MIATLQFDMFKCPSEMGSSGGEELQVALGQLSSAAAMSVNVCLTLMLLLCHFQFYDFLQKKVE